MMTYKDLYPVVFTGSITQVSTDVETVFTNSQLDATRLGMVSYTYIVTGNQVQVAVYAANQADFSDEVQINITGQAAGSTGKFATDGTIISMTSAAYRFYRVKIFSKNAGFPGTVVLSGLAKVR